MPAYDNYDGSEQFWRHYELSLLSKKEREKIYDDLGKDFIGQDEIETCEWCYTWSVCIYYSVLVIGGNEL